MVTRALFCVKPNTLGDSEDVEISRGATAQPSYGSIGTLPPPLRINDRKHIVLQLRWTESDEALEALV